MMAQQAVSAGVGSRHLHCALLGTCRIARRVPAPRQESRAGRAEAAGCSTRRAYRVAHGEGHREAHPPALADLVPHGRAAARDGARDPARRRGLQRDERGRVRPPLLRRPLRARLARDRADASTGRSTASPSRRTTRCGRRTSTCRRSRSPTTELAALQTALTLLDGEFAYAEPLRLALQQISWGRPSPLRAPEQRGVALGITASAGGHELSQRLAKIETAIFRHKTITFDYYTMERDEDGRAQGRPLPPALPGRPVLPAGPLARARRDPRLPPVAHPRQGRLRDEGRARLPAPRGTSTRAPTPTAPTGSSATDAARPRSGSPSASPGRSSATSAATASPRGRRRRRHVFRTRYADAPARLVGARLGEHARVLGPPELERELAEPRRAARRAPRAASAELAPARPRPRRPRGARRARRDGDGARTRPRSAPSASRAS